MTTLVMHTLAQPTECKFVPKCLIQTNTFLIEIALDLGVSQQRQKYVGKFYMYSLLAEDHSKKICKVSSMTTQSSSAYIFLSLLPQTQTQQDLNQKSICLVQTFGQKYTLCWLCQTVLYKCGHTKGQWDVAGPLLKKNYLKKRDDEQPFRELYIKNYGVLL